MRSAKILAQSLADFDPARSHVPPANIMVLGRDDLIFEPLLLEALANHPGCDALWYVPMTGKGAPNMQACRDDAKAFFEELRSAKKLDGLSNLQRARMYGDGPKSPAPLLAYNIAPLLKRHDGAALSSDEICTRLQSHFAQHEPASISTDDPDVILDGSGSIHFGGYVTRRADALVIENDPVMSEVMSNKISLPRIEDEIRRQSGKRVTTDCAAIHTVAELRAFMDRHGLDQVALKETRNVGGRGVFRIFRDTSAGKLMGESAEQSGDESSKGTRIFSLTEDFIKPPGMLAMRWLDNDKGDMRVIIQNGSCVGAYLRRHAPNNWLCNVEQGGSIHPVDLKRDISPADRQKISAVAKYLHEKGVNRAALDWLADENGERFLSEINTGFTDGISRIHAHDLGKQAAFGRLTLPDQMAADLLCEYRDQAQDTLCQHRYQHAVNA